MLADVSSAGENAAVGVDGETERALIALGYIGGELSAERQAELDSLDLSGGDANLLAGDIQEMAVAIGHLKRQRWDEGVASLQGLAGKHPESVPILIRLVRALEKDGRGREAVPIARRMVELDPGDIGHHVRLVELLLETGEIEGAIAALWPLLELDACAERPRMYLYSLLQSRSDYSELSRMMEQGYERCPESAWNLNAYAWVLATSPVASLRDGALAVRVAERLISSVETDEMDSAYLDTLAAAHAEAGSFDRAIDAVLRALTLARKRGEPRERIESFEGHLADFRLGRAVRDS
jgi:tetratricopeptide (TPR) repeat protein